MAEIFLSFAYDDSSDVLSCQITGRQNAPGGQTAVFPFAFPDDLPASAFVLFLGMDDETGETTGELVGLEMPYFLKTFERIRPVVRQKFNLSIPAEHRGNAILFGQVSLELIHEDIRPDDDTVLILAKLVEMLDDVYFFVRHHKELKGRLQHQFRQSDAQVKESIRSAPVGGELICC